MSRRPLIIAGTLALSLFAIAPTAAQSPPIVQPLPAVETLPPDQVAAARELVITMKTTQQLKALVPMLVKNMKSAMLVGRSPEFARDFEALMPVLISTFEQRYDEFADLIAGVYAANFSADELHDMSAFYQTPTGQKVLRMMPTIAQQSLQAGQVYGHKLGEEIKQRAIEELRKRGHEI
jgi:hypothetical protein